MNNMSELKITIRSLRKIIKLAPWSVLLAILISLIHGIMQVSSIRFYKSLFDSIEFEMNTNGVLANLIGPILVVCLIEALILLLHGLYSFFCIDYLNRNIYGVFKYELHKKAANIELIEFEDPELFELLNRAMGSIKNGIDASINILSAITYYVPFFIFLFIYLYSLNPLLSIMLVFTFAPIIVSQKISTRIMRINFDNTKAEERKITYFRQCLVSKDFLKETRLLGAYDFFYTKYFDSIDRLNNFNKKSAKQIFKISFSMRIVRSIGYGFNFLILFYSLVNGNITIASFGSIFIALEKLNGIASELVTLIGDTYQKSILAKDMYKYLDLNQKNESDMELSRETTIELKNVSFIYPNSNDFALKDIDLRITKGETIAIVGENGAGKTTLSKLILGLYNASEGEIHFDNKKISDYTVSSMRKDTSAIFQQFQKYKFNLADNIAISQTSFFNNSCNPKRIRSLCDEFNIRHFDNNIVLAKEYGGEELSLGEWQRIAIARGIFRDYKIIVLDEPTSSIDPIEENSIFTKLESICSNSTAIIITHRLASVKFADRIVVLDRGKIVEEGKHEQLLQLNGLYHEMWSAQSKWYFKS